MPRPDFSNSPSHAGDQFQSFIDQEKKPSPRDPFIGRLVSIREVSWHG